jgi:Ca-activated chloride channel family protein
VRLEHITCAAERGNIAYLLVLLEAELSPQRPRNPVNLVLVIDRSSSMRGPRLDQALATACQVLARLDHRDRLSLLTFDSAVRTVFGPEPVTEVGRQRAVEAITAVDTGSGTNLGNAIKIGAEVVRSGFLRGSRSRLILLTDGQPTVGITNHERLCELVAREAERGITTTTMGLGEAFDDDLLAGIARFGRGRFYYLAEPADIPAAFGRELTGVFSLTATDVALKLAPCQSVRSVELLHRVSSRPVDDGLLVNIGEVAADAPRTLLFRLGRSPGASFQLGSLTLTYRDVDGRAEHPRIFGVELSHPAPPEVVRAVTAERMRIAVAQAIDAAWVRRAGGDGLQALSALADVQRDLERERDHGSLALHDAEILLYEVRAAGEAILKTAVEREQARRSMRERTQITLLGHSLSHLPLEDEET